MTDALEIYECLRRIMTESELRAFLAAVQIGRARHRLTSEELRWAIMAWHVLYVFEPERIIHVRQRLDLELLPPETFRAYFRFSRHHITPLRQMLGIADTFVASDHKIHGDDALLILLSRMTSKQRLIDLENRFGLSSAFLSDVTLSLVRSFHAQWFPLLFCAKQCFTEERLHAYSRAIADKIYVLTGSTSVVLLTVYCASVIAHNLCALVVKWARVLAIAECLEGAPRLFHHD